MPADPHRISEMAALIAQNLDVTDAGRMAGIRDDVTAWDTYEELTIRGAAAGNQVLAAAMGIKPGDIFQAFKDALTSEKREMTEGATKDSGAKFELVPDTANRVKAAQILADYTGMNPGKKLEVKTTTQSFGLNLNVDVTELLKNGSVGDMIKQLQVEAGLAD